MVAFMRPPHGLSDIIVFVAGGCFNNNLIKKSFSFSPLMIV